MRHHLNLIAAMLLAALYLSLTSCESDTNNPKELVGTWLISQTSVNSNLDNKYKAVELLLQLRSDGTAVGVNAFYYSDKEAAATGRTEDIEIEHLKWHEENGAFIIFSFEDGQDEPSMYKLKDNELSLTFLDSDSERYTLTFSRVNDSHIEKYLKESNNPEEL